jgi:hypothetical protein
VLELDNLFAEIALPLDAQGASVFVHQVAIEALGDGTGSADHGLEGSHALYRAGKPEKQADTLIHVRVYARQIEGSRLGEAGNAKHRSFVVI